jgi:beta-galactosidase
MVRRVAASERAAIDPGYEAVPPRLQEPLFHDWTPQQNGAHDEMVEVYSNCEEVELLLNGRSLGRQKLHADASPLVWSVPYAPGSLTAVGYNHGERAADDELRTAGKAARLVLTPERKALRNDRNDVMTVVVTVVDDAGVVVPTASDLVQFSVSGPGEIVAADNGSPTDHELFQLPQHHLYKGRAVVLLRATAGSGEIRLRGSAPGLSEGEATLSAIPGGGSDVVRAF